MQTIELTDAIHITVASLAYLVSIEDAGGGTINLKFMRDGSTQTVAATAEMSDIVDKVNRGAT